MHTNENMEWFMAIKYELFYLQSRETMSVETMIKTPLRYSYQFAG